MSIAKTADVKPTVVPDPEVAERAKVIRHNIFAKVKTEKPAKVDIHSIGVNRFRVNVWKLSGVKSDAGFFEEKRIVETFVHIEN